MFEKMITDELLALRDAVADQADTVAADGNSTMIAVEAINARLALIDRELDRRAAKARRAKARRVSKGLEWLFDATVEARRCPLCGQLIISDGLGFARHLVEDLRRAEKLTGRKFATVKELADYQEWTGFEIL